jgi:hypothetical protein
MAKTLEMTFTTEQGKKALMRVNNVKDNVTKEEVATLMNTILSKNIFSTSSGDLKAIVSASITDKNITQLEVK